MSRKKKRSASSPQVNPQHKSKESKLDDFIRAQNLEPSASNRAHSQVGGDPLMGGDHPRENSLLSTHELLSEGAPLYAEILADHCLLIARTVEEITPN